jgi:RNA polymerase sigma factor (sigma-70 family)
MTHTLKTMSLKSLVLPGLRRLDVAPEQRTQQRSKLKAKTNKQTQTKTNRYQSDPRLVNACLAGDSSAWNELVKRYKWLIYSVPRKYGLAAADAEDVMQNVFVIVYRRLSTLRDHTRLSAWLIRIAHHETIHHLERATPDDELNDEMLDLGDPPVEQVQRLEAQNVVHQALEQLHPHCRAMLELVLSDESPSYEQVARWLGCPLGSVGPTRARCFKKLEAVLVKMGADIVP